MKVMSLFDGISCARVALKRAGFNVEKYYASEIDKYAIQVAQKNFPDTIQIGGVKGIIVEDGWFFHNQNNDPINNGGSFINDIDLLIGGSPCQDLSIAKKDRKGLDGEKSSLFWEYVRILKEIKPKYFVLENVNSMSKENKAIITETLGVEPVMINASLVSAQNRKRLFWTNIEGVTQPEDKGIYLKDVLESGEIDERMITKNKKSFVLTASHAGAIEKNSVEKKQRTMIRVGHLNKGSQGDRVYSTEGKSVSLSANGGGGGAKTGLYMDSVKNGEVRKLTPIECERLQGLSDNHTEGISNSQRYKCLGNAFNVDVVSHIFTFLK